MTHRTTARFWQLYQQLPEEIQQLAVKNFALLKTSPAHPSLRFKKVGQLWSARVGLHYRCLARENPDGFTWVWIGPHAEYDRILR